MDPNSMIQPQDEDEMNPNSMIQSQDDSEDEDEDVPYDSQDAAVFRQLVMEDKWEEVIKKYEEHVFFQKIKIMGRGTALHVAVSNAYKDGVKRLVDAIERHGDLSGLILSNERDATPLHIAAYRGFTSMCECIIGEDGERKHLIREKNAKGETPLFWAVLARHKKTFLYLHQFFPYDINLAINNNGATILHVAIHREIFGMANMIMHLYPIFRSMEDKDGESPLEILATRKSAFKSGNKLSWWKKILYNCVSVKVWDAKTRIELYEKGLMSEDEEDKDKSDQSEISIRLFNVNESEKAGKSLHALTRLDFTSCVKILCYHIQMFVFTIWHIMFPSPRKRWPTKSLLGAIKSVKKNHIYGGQLLEAFMKDPYGSYMVGGAVPFDDGEHDKKTKEKARNFADIGRKFQQEETMKNIESELSVKKIGTKDTAYLIAAKHGITEMMRALEFKLNSVIHETNSNNENALLLAVKNRQPQVVEGLWKSFSMKTFESLNLQVDRNENTIVHLAAFATSHKENTAWRISGAAMQMMWDIKWYKYIKRLVPDHFHYRSNTEGKTPGEIFKEEHTDLLQQSIEWLKETSESCSVVAALVAGVSFATSGSVPGGNQETGKPTFEGQPAFEGFAVSSLVGLYFSVTALIMFLSILTSRKQVEDFNRNLPMKLLFGLSSLFVAIVSMFISFIAGHYFVLTDKYTKSGILFFLYISICLPVTFYAVVQFPLYIDLVKVIWKKVPPPSIKGVQL